MSQHRRLILTAFGPFPGCPVNPTERLARGVQGRLDGPGSPLPGWSVELMTLPTTWAAPAELVARLRAEKPAVDAVIALGVRGDATEIHVERRAHNQAGAEKVDADGKLAGTVRLVREAPPHLEGRMHQPPFGDVVERARAAGHPVSYSDDAGRYVCNALFFLLLHAFPPERGPLVGFVHVPHIAPLGADKTGTEALDEQALVASLTALVVGYCRAIASVA